jgi:hypothetical protein
MVTQFETEKGGGAPQYSEAEKNLAKAKEMIQPK